MTSAEKALLDAACEHWISGRFNHLIIAVIQEREAKKTKMFKQIPALHYRASVEHALMEMGVYSPVIWEREGQKRIQMYIAMDLTPEQAADELKPFFEAQLPRMIKPGRGFIASLLESGACKSVEFIKGE